MSNRILQATLRLMGQDAGAGRMLASVGGKMEQMDRRAEAFNRRNGAFMRGQAMLVGGTARLLAGVAGPAAIAAGMTAAVRGANSLEEALFGIEKKSGASAAQMARIKQEILDLNDELPSAIEDIAAAYERGAAAGLPLEDLREFTKLSVKVADAFEMSEEEVGNVFAGWRTALGLTGGAVEKLTDQINYLADAGIADERDLVQFIDQSSGLIKNWGLSEGQVAALAATMKNLKLDTSAAATSMQNLTSRLLAPDVMNKDGIIWMQKLVGDTKEFHKLVKDDAQGALLKFLDSLSELDRFQRAEALTRIVGRGYFMEIQTLSSNLDEYRRNLRMLQNESAYMGGIDRVFERRMELNRVKWGMVWKQLDELSRRAGDMAFPALKAGADRMLDLFKYMEENGTPFEHMAEAIDGFAKGAGYEDFSTMLSDIGDQIDRIAGGGDGKWELTDTFNAAAEAGAALATVLERIERAMLNLERVKLWLNVSGATTGFATMTQRGLRALGRGAQAINPADDVSAEEALRLFDQEFDQIPKDIQEKRKDNLRRLQEIDARLQEIDRAETGRGAVVENVQRRRSDRAAIAQHTRLARLAREAEDASMAALGATGGATPAAPGIAPPSLPRARSSAIEVPSLPSAPALPPEASLEETMRAYERMAELQDEMKEAKAIFDIDPSAGLARIQAIREEMEDLATVKPSVDVNIDPALASLKRLEAEAAQTGRRVNQALASGRRSGLRGDVGRSMPAEAGMAEE
ncbi:phage tail tape measure protein [Afifella sp. YEN Y35]|uniref:phage tail tape measure protein n=1 Tax=Afifella sp. YEN Y35 TaxID=3388337 RepID=UPI0039DF8064